MCLGVTFSEVRISDIGCVLTDARVNDSLASLPPVVEEPDAGPVRGLAKAGAGTKLNGCSTGVQQSLLLRIGEGDARRKAALPLMAPGQ